MSIKSLIPAAAVMAVATLALTGCTQNNAAPSDTSSTSSPATSAPTTSDASTAPATSDASTAPSQDNATPIIFNESNEHLTIPAGTTTVIVNGSNNEIDGGEVTAITVAGSNNSIEVESVSTVSFTGSNNEIEYEEGNAPQVTSDLGASNEIFMSK
jgi:putative lipoprotein